MRGHDGAVWIFAYGSLLWQPAFQQTAKKRARLPGYRRSFCLWTALARGTPEIPGLGLGVVEDDATACDGIALRTGEVDRERQLADLWEREMWTDAYVPIWTQLDTDEGRVEALVFAANGGSRQFAGTLSAQKSAQIIARASGKYGTCRDYLEQTFEALSQDGIVCPEITKVREALPP